MKRALIFAVILSLWAVAWSLASEPMALDRNGVLWRLTATPTGTVLVGTKEGQEVARSQVPFTLGLAGQSDVGLQLLADDLTGKVVVAWQRNWSAFASEIILAVWSAGEWERIDHVTGEPGLRPRNPVLRLARAVSNYPDPVEPQKSLTSQDAYALLLWWQDFGDAGHPRLALLDLQAPPGTRGALTVVPLKNSVDFGIGCPQSLPGDVLEHPKFASASPGPVTHVLAASPSACLLFVHEIRFELEPPRQGAGDAEGGLGVTAQRRRHTPIFGVRKVLPVTRELSAEGTRAVLGADLQPVLYRVLPEGVEYTVATEQGWSAKRLLKLENGLTLDRAIALVENLAR
ncbi:MAG: hypothetical protein N2447_07860 [Thermoanaerobaculum sp.]|nr:hypothetical protein [Thermoanaerobaculum sp.]